MSAETMEWLNQMTLIGFSEKRGKAWHYKQAAQGQEPNHYVGGVPLDDVVRRLMSWDALEGSSETSVLTPDGFLHFKDPKNKHIVRPPGALHADDPGGIVGHVGGQAGEAHGWKLHQYREWLLKALGDILDTSDLHIGSAGLLQMGAKAWVSVEAPDNITTPSGVVFRPFILAATALDGSLSTTYKRVVTNVVCDNTMAAALGEQGQVLKVRHTRNSTLRLSDVRKAIDVVPAIAADFTEMVEQLTNVTFTAADFDSALNRLVPLQKDGERLTGRSLSLATAKRDKIAAMQDDPRCAPWKGTAWGLVQTINTFTHHVQGTSNMDGAAIGQRQMLRAIEGGVDKLDRDTLALVRAIKEGEALAAA